MTHTATATATDEATEAAKAVRRERARERRVQRRLESLELREWLRPNDLEAKYGYPANTWRQWVRRGRLPAKRIGKSICVRRSDADAFMESQPDYEKALDA